MLRCCIVCKVEATPHLQLQYCAACQSALYCSEACQRINWRKQHKKICKLLNVWHENMQFRDNIHTSQSIGLKEAFETEERSFDDDEDTNRFFKLFKESTFDGSQAAARKMRKIAKRETKNNQKFLLFHSLNLLIRSDSDMLSRPNSPLLVLLQFVDSSAVSGSEHEPLLEGSARGTPLHSLAYLADTIDYSTHENQLILARQLIEHGANVNAVSIPQGNTPLQFTCAGDNVTNLDFVEYLLKEGADPNFQDHRGLTPLMFTTPNAPGAAKFLLNWPTTDVNITTQSGASFLARVRKAIRDYSNQIALTANPYQIQHQFTLQQWRDIEEMLMERGAPGTGITAPL
jgi:hypothetical protein